MREPSASGPQNWSGSRDLHPHDQGGGLSCCCYIRATYRTSSRRAFPSTAGASAAGSRSGSRSSTRPSVGAAREARGLPSRVGAPCGGMTPHGGGFREKPSINASRWRESNPRSRSGEPVCHHNTSPAAVGPCVWKRVIGGSHASWSARDT